MISNEKKQADSFAAEFLAPLDDVVQFLEEIKGDNPDKEVQISMLSDKFKISNTLAFYRWQEAQGVMNDWLRAISQKEIIKSNTDLLTAFNESFQKHVNFSDVSLFIK